MSDPVSRPATRSQSVGRNKLFEKTVCVFDLWDVAGEGVDVEKIRTSALHHSGEFLPICEIDPDPSPELFHLVFKISIRGQCSQSKEELRP